MIVLRLCWPLRLFPHCWQGSDIGRCLFPLCLISPWGLFQFNYFFARTKIYGLTSVWIKLFTAKVHVRVYMCVRVYFLGVVVLYTVPTTYGVGIRLSQTHLRRGVGCQMINVHPDTVRRPLRHHLKVFPPTWRTASWRWQAVKIHSLWCGVAFPSRWLAANVSEKKKTIVWQWSGGLLCPQMRLGGAVLCCK